jgi:hypothetical protein
VRGRKTVHAESVRGKWELARGAAQMQRLYPARCINSLVCDELSVVMLRGKMDPPSGKGGW